MEKGCELLFFACPKKSNQKKWRPEAYPFGVPSILTSIDARLNSLCSDNGELYPMKAASLGCA
jgi:hypothetical protein